MTPSVLILIVEDEDLIRHVLEDALTEGGFSVAVAASGEEAMALLDTRGSEFSALVTDVNLAGGISGWDVARRAREINETMPVVYTTGASAHDWASKGVPKSQMMPKPFAVAQVLTAVAHLINEAASPI